VAAVAPPLPVIPGYETLDVLGQGGMGIVYKARDRRLPRLVALKMIRGGRHASAEELERFRRETNAVARLQHPNVIQIYEVGEQDGLPYCALEFAGGGSLARKSAGAPQPCRASAELVAVLARAVHAAHEQGVVHRDLKPSNVLLTEDGTPKVADFGLAKFLGDRAGTCGGHLTQTAAALGTPCYMAPEQADGASAVGPAADTYALGVILYELLTGRPPFRGATGPDTLRLVRTCEPVPPRKLRPDVPHDLETICLKCLEKAPARRYASAADLADDLHRFLEERTIVARRPSLASRAVRRLRRHPALALAAVLALLLAVVVFVDSRRPPPVPPTLPDPEAPLREMEEDLAAGRPVRLLGDRGKPRWSAPWMEQPGDLQPLGSEEPYTLRGWSSAMLELLPAVPQQSYRLRAQVQHRDGGDLSSVGFYFAHGTREDGPAREHCYCMVSFADLGNEAVKFPVGGEAARYPGFVHSQCGLVELTLGSYPEKGRLTSSMSFPTRVKAPFLTAEHFKRLRPALFAELVPALAVNPQAPFPGQLPLAGLFLVSPPNPSLLPGGPPPWRTLEVTVSPAGVRLVWDGAPVGVLPAAELSAARPFVLPNDLTARPEFRFNPEGGIGLYVCRGSGSFRDVTIDPND